MFRLLNAPVEVPPVVFAIVSAVQETGMVDMRDLHSVVRLMHEWKFAETASWIESNPDRYLEGLSSGLRPAA